MSAPVFLTETDRLQADRVVLDGPEGHHAAAVRRIRAGERVDLTDGAGLRAECVVVETGRSHLTLSVGDRRSEPPPQPRLVLVQAIPKGDRGELAVELMTEAGADEIVPWQASRCVAQWRGERREKAVARWRARAREAAKQARRAWLPEVTDTVTTAQVTERIAGAACALILDEEAVHRVGDVTPPEAGELVVVVGPEGGLSQDELELFAGSGALLVRLGPTVLRTSTAGLAAAAVLFSRCGRW